MLIQTKFIVISVMAEVFIAFVTKVIAGQSREF